MAYKKTAIIVWSLILLSTLAGLGLLLAGLSFRRAFIVQSAEGHMAEAFSAYENGSLKEATNAFYSYINYLSNYRRELTGKLKVDLMLYIAHARLSYLFLSSYDIPNAQSNLEEAYIFYQKAGLPQKTKPDFIDYVIAGNQTLDSKNAAKWFTPGVAWTNAVKEMRKGASPH